MLLLEYDYFLQISLKMTSYTVLGNDNYFCCKRTKNMKIFELAEHLN